MISLDEALGLTAKHALDLANESVPIAQAVGRQLAADIAARHDQPPADVSVMDGYAVRQADLDDGVRDFALIGESRAGLPFGESVSAGQAVRIFTGAHLPDGADRVVMQENVARDGDTAHIAEASGPTFVRERGRDFAKEQVLAKAGTVLRATHVLSLSAAGHGELRVRARPVIGLLRGGDELVPAGQALRPGQIVDANGPGLTALLQAWGCEVRDVGIAPDDADALAGIVAQGSDGLDALITVGGASVGDHDHMQAVFGRLGFDPLFSKVSVKPGKPTWLSRKDDLRVLGLPGNPSSAWVCAVLFAQVLIGRPLAFQDLPAAVDLPAGGPRSELLRAVLGEDGVTPLPRQDSGLTSPLPRATHLLLRPAGGTAVKAGDPVRVLRNGA